MRQTELGIKVLRITTLIKAMADSAQHSMALRLL